MLPDLVIDHNMLYLLAFSGGLDSSVLAFLLKKQKANLELLHILTPDLSANPELKLKDKRYNCVLNLANMLGSKLHLAASDSNNWYNLIDFRNLKYDTLSRYTNSNTIVLTAHHLDDQIATLLIKFSRASNPDSWQILPWQKFGKGYLWRPLLNTTKQELKSYSNRHNIIYFDDTEFNNNPKYKRNVINNQITPNIYSIGSPKAFIESFRLLNMQRQIIQHVIIKIYDQVSHEKKIKRACLKLQPSYLYAEIIRYWLQKEYQCYPSGKVINLISNYLSKEISSSIITIYPNKFVIITPDHVTFTYKLNEVSCI